jgi:Uma2 family endonuclease
MIAARAPAADHDHIVVLRGAAWSDYQRVLELRGDKSAPRIAFLEGDLEILRPSSSHENIKSLIGRLVEVYCLEHDLEFRALGAWTLEDKTVARGVEPDECYVLSTDPDAQRPDLAIEVVWTSGGIAKLDIYRKLGVREVWFWRDGVLSVHLLHGESYVTTTTSAALPGLDLALLASFLDRPTTSAAIKAYRAALTAPKP